MLVVCKNTWNIILKGEVKKHSPRNIRLRVDHKEDSGKNRFSKENPAGEEMEGQWIQRVVVHTKWAHGHSPTNNESSRRRAGAA